MFVRSFNGKPARNLTKQQQAELLRQMVDTVGLPGRPGVGVGEHVTGRRNTANTDG